MSAGRVDKCSVRLADAKLVDSGGKVTDSFKATTCVFLGWNTTLPGRHSDPIEAHGDDASKASSSFWTRCKAAAVKDSNESLTRELIRLGMDPTLRTLRDQLTEEGRAYFAKEMRARDKETRLKKERVDASKASPSFWARYKAWAVEDFKTGLTIGLVRGGFDPSIQTLEGHFTEEAQRARDMEMGRHKKERVDVGGTWAGNLHRAYSSMLARRSRRVAPSASTAASEVTGACLKREGTLGGSGGAAGLSVATKVLNEYTCPITAEIMTDPVSTLDGFTYERTAITEWLRTNDTSPSTGAKLESKRLIPNVTVRCLLQHL